METLLIIVAILIAITYLLFFFGLFRYMFWAIATPLVGLFFQEKNEETKPKKLDNDWLQERSDIMNNK